MPEGENVASKWIREHAEGFQKKVGKYSTTAGEKVGKASAWAQRQTEKTPVKVAIGAAGLGYATGKWGGSKIKGVHGALSSTYHAAKGTFVPYLILAFLFHIIDAGFGFPRGVRVFEISFMFSVQVGFGVIMWAVFFRQPDDDPRTSLKKVFGCIGVGMFAYFFPVIVPMIAKSKIVGGRGINIVLNPLIHPIWIYYGLVTFKDSKLANKILTGLVMFWTFYLIFGFMAQGGDFGRQTLTPENYQNVFDLAQEWYLGASNFVGLMTTGVWGGFQRVVNQTFQATGADFYYTGQVDRQAEEKLGVFIKDLSPASPEFFDDEPVSVWATIEARTLDKPISIKAECYTYDIEDKPKDPRQDPAVTQGKLTPMDNFVVDRLEVEDLECFFERLSEGRQYVGFKADFDFQTQAYYRTYFMDINRLRSYRVEKIDILREFGIKDTNPNAIYTNGPLNIGMRVKEPPVGIGRYDTDDEDVEVEVDRISLRITIENKWEGKVTGIKQFVLMIPKGFDIIDDDGLKCGEFVFEHTGCEGLGLGERCDDELNNVYHLKNDSMKSLSIEEYRHVSCPLLIDADAVLSETPITAQYFKVLIDYDYQIKDDLLLRIKESGLDDEDLSDVGLKMLNFSVDFNQDITDAKYLQAFIHESGDSRTREGEINQIILEQAKANDVSFFLLKAIVQQETGFKNNEFDCDAAVENTWQETADGLSCDDCRDEINDSNGKEYHKISCRYGYAKARYKEAIKLCGVTESEQLYDAAKNIECAAKHLKKLKDECGGAKRAVYGYKYGTRFCKETDVDNDEYVKEVVRLYELLQEAAS